MSGFSFTKLFSSITDSSIWQEPSDVRVVWVTLMAMADHAGRVHASVPGLARRANVARELAEQALHVFMSPDPDSRSKNNDGRRVEEIDGGWRLINHQFYREVRDPESRRQQNREAQARLREKKAALEEENSQPEVSQSQPESAEVSLDKPLSAYAEAEAEAEAEAVSTKAKANTFIDATRDGSKELHPDLVIYQAYPRKVGKGAALKSIRQAVARLKKGETPHDPMQAIEAQRYLMRRVLEYARSPAGLQADQTMIPHPATWFNQSRYEDDQSNWHRTEKTSGSGNGGKTGGNLDAAAQAVEFLRQRRANRGDVDDLQHSQGVSSERGSFGDLRGRLIEA